MRVLHVIPSVAPRYGGPSLAVVRYCRALRTRGVEAVIATTNADGERVLPVPTGCETTFEDVPTWFFPRAGEAFKYSSSLAQWLRQAISGFDLVHVHAVFSHSSIAAGRAAAAARVPYIVRPLGSLDPWSMAQSAWKKRLLLWSAAGSVLKGAAGLHFTTVEERELARPVTGKAPGEVIPLGVDDRYLGSPLVPMADRDARVVAIARFHPKKNLEALVNAFHAVAVKSGLERWSLTVAGSGEEAYVGHLRACVAAGPAAGRIELNEWIDGEAKLQLLRWASLFAVPSHQENFGLGALEAMACGVPVLASPGVNLSRQIWDAGAGWITGPSAEEIAVTLEAALRDDAGRDDRSANARRLAGAFSWDAAAERLEAWYSQLARRSMPAMMERA